MASTLARPLLQHLCLVLRQTQNSLQMVRLWIASQPMGTMAATPAVAGLESSSLPCWSAPRQA